MGKEFIPSDVVDDAGNAHDTVGENIRNGVRSENGVKGTIKAHPYEYTFGLGINTNVIRKFLIDILTGKDAEFALGIASKLTDEELTAIKTYLGVASTTKAKRTKEVEK